jgi:hypothetical protein
MRIGTAKLRRLQRIVAAGRHQASSDKGHGSPANTAKPVPRSNPAARSIPARESIEEPPPDRLCHSDRRIQAKPLLDPASAPPPSNRSGCRGRQHHPQFRLSCQPNPGHASSSIRSSPSRVLPQTSSLARLRQPVLGSLHGALQSGAARTSYLRFPPSRTRSGWNTDRASRAISSSVCAKTSVKCARIRRQSAR